MQLLAQSQARVAAQRRSSRSAAAVNISRHAVSVPGPARLVAGSRRPTIRVQAQAQTATGPAAGTSPLTVGTIALRKAVAQAAYKGTNVFVVGGQGELAVRVIRELLGAGFKVTAGVADLEAASTAFSFFKRYELIDKASAANLKLVSLASLEEDEAAIKALPKRAKVVVIDGDVEGKGRTGAKEVKFALALAEATAASQVVLVSTQASAPAAPSGGLFGGLFAAPKPAAPVAGKPLDKLSKVEQLVADSGKPYTILRAFGSDRTDDGTEPGTYVQIGTLGSVPTSALSSKKQVASVLGELLKAAGPTNQIVFEMSASEEEQLSAADAIGEIIAAAEATAAEAAAAAAEEAAKSPAPSLPLFGLGTLSIQRKAEAEAAAEAPAPEEPPAEEAAPPKKTGTGFFSFAALAAPAKKEEAKEEEEEAPAAATRSARRAAAARVVKKEEPEVVVEEEAPKKTGTGFFGFGTAKVSVKKEEPKKEEPKEEEPEPPKKTGTGFFSFGTAKVSVKKEAPKEEPKEEEPELPKKTGTGFFSFGTAKVSAKKEAPKEEPEEEEEPPKKTGTGFFSFGRPAKKAVEEEEEEAKPAPAKRGTSIRGRAAPPPPPPEPAPKRGTAIRGRAAPAPEPAPAPPKRGISARRAPEPEPAPAPQKRAAPPPPPPRAKPAPEPKKAAPPPPPPAPARGTTTSRVGTTTSRTSAGTSSVSSRTSSSSSGSSKVSASSSRSSSASRSSRSAPAKEDTPTYAPGTRGARIAALKAQQEAEKQQQQQRRK